MEEESALANSLEVGTEGRVIFFFSSRRRHTRCGRDWSSDVCSSDLTGRVSQEDLSAMEQYLGPSTLAKLQAGGDETDDIEDVAEEEGYDDIAEVFRSEERRVGKECRSRRSPWH